MIQYIRLYWSGLLLTLVYQNSQSNIQGLVILEAPRATCPQRRFVVLLDSRHGFFISRQRIPQVFTISSLPASPCRLVSLFKGIDTSSSLSISPLSFHLSLKGTGWPTAKADLPHKGHMDSLPPCWNVSNSTCGCHQSNPQTQLRLDLAPLSRVVYLHKAVLYPPENPKHQIEFCI